MLGLRKLLLFCERKENYLQQSELLYESSNSQADSETYSQADPETDSEADAKADTRAHGWQQIERNDGVLRLSRKEKKRGAGCQVRRQW